MVFFPPLFMALVEAGFPSPADDWIEASLDLNQFLVKKPTATFYIRVKGDSMIQAGIHEGDVLIVDRSITPCHDRIVIAALNGELTVKRLSKDGDKVQLVPDNPKYRPIDIDPESDFRIWGVVIGCVRKL